MRVLALDISTSTGFAVFEGGAGELAPGLKAFGTVLNEKTVHEYGPYPYCYLASAQAMAEKIAELAKQHIPDVIVIEETNGSKSRYTQKILEFIHCCVISELTVKMGFTSIFYINTSDWRKSTSVALSAEEKKQNAKLSKAKSKAGGKLTPAQKKAIGIKGRVTKKHVAVRVANEKFNLSLKIGQNDIADAICLGAAYLDGVKICDGK